MKAKRFNDGGVSKPYSPYITKEAVDKVLEQAKTFKDDGFGKITPKDAVRALGSDVKITDPDIDLSKTTSWKDALQQIDQLDAEQKRKKQKLSDEKTTNKMAKGGSVKSSSASRRADGCAVRGKTKGRML